MPKAILEYNLPEELGEYETAMNGGNYSYMLDEIRRYVRHLRKYDERDTIPKDEIVDKLNELMDEYEG